MSNTYTDILRIFILMIKLMECHNKAEKLNKQETYKAKIPVFDNIKSKLLKKVVICVEY